MVIPPIPRLSLHVETPDHNLAAHSLAESPAPATDNPQPTALTDDPVATTTPQMNDAQLAQWIDMVDGPPKPIAAHHIDSPRPTTWLWPNRIAVGQVHVLAGNPGLGKSLVSLDIAARLSTGRPWPDQPPSTPHRQPHNVLLFTCEDSRSQTILPRLRAAGANISRIYFHNDGTFDGQPMIPRDLSKLLSHIHQASAALVIFDPLLPFLDAKAMAGAHRAYQTILKLREMARCLPCAILAVVHVTKTSYRAAIQRISGGAALAAVARSVSMVTPDHREENPDPHRRLLISIKNNLGPPPPAIGYSVADSRIIWHPDQAPSSIDPDSLLSLPPQKPGPDPVKLDACTAWLAQQLQAGPRSRAELITLGATAGFSRSTIDRAKAALRLAHAIAPDQRHLWSLPTPSPATPSPRSDRT